MEHHIVQKEYLRQWATDNQLNIYSIPEKKIIRRGPDWQGFKIKDFNVFTDQRPHDYTPESVTAHIDTEALNVIRKINTTNLKLDGYDKSCLAFYFSLQYLRVPKRREELDKFMSSAYSNLYKGDFVEYVKNKDIDTQKLIEEEENAFTREKLKDGIGDRTDIQMKQEVMNMIESDDFKLKLSTAGHSKQMVKMVQNIAKDIFYCKWTFLVPSKKICFITSDSPCFTSSSTKLMQGILSPNTISYFPLRPDLCLSIIPSQEKYDYEAVMPIDGQMTRAINQLTVKNSYNFIIAKDMAHLEKLTSSFDFSTHKKSKDIKVSKMGDCTMFNAE